jgi:hypothetical protein
MLTTDCPLCDGPASVEAGLAAIDCAACGQLEIAPDPPVAVELAQAA